VHPVPADRLEVVRREGVGDHEDRSANKLVVDAATLKS
jgi:hypothetical protein